MGDYIRTYGGRGPTEQSTFLQQIERLHARFSIGAELGRSDLKDVISRGDMAPVYYGAGTAANFGSFMQRHFPTLPFNNTRARAFLPSKIEPRYYQRVDRVVQSTQTQL